MTRASTRLANRRTPFAVSLLLAAVTVACGPTRNASLESARSAYRDARSDPTVDRLAPVALHDAESELRTAEQAWEDGEDEATEHHAYLAQKKVDLALARARLGDAQRDTAALHDAKGDIVLAAREREIEILKDARRTDRGIVVTLEDVLFEFDEADLKPGAERRLLEVVEFLRNNPERRVSIEGHTDAVGSSSYNRDLSQRRASSVRRFLTAQGVTGDRIHTRGYGESYPVAPNDNASGRQQNRRVEVVILDADEEPRPPVG